MPTVVSKTELARRLNLDRSRISQLISRGLPVRPDKKIDLESALAWIAANGRPHANFPDRGVSKVMDGAGADSAVADGLPYAEARALRETYQARLARLDYEAKSGRLLDAEAVEREWSAILGGVRARMLAVASRCGGRLPHLTTHDIVEIDHEIRTALTELGDGDAA